jgi:hypothetical protein
VANSNPQGNNKKDNSPSTLMASKGRIMIIIGGNIIIMKTTAKRGITFEE